MEPRAGRELDAVVHEFVFKEPVLRHPSFVDGPQINPKDGSPRRHLPEYSKNIADAWRVVEKMRDKGFCIFELSIDGTGEYSCHFDKTWPGANDVFNREAPMAICLAALEALGHSGEVGK